MMPTNLPIEASAQTATPSPVATLSQTDSADFLLMLAQLIETAAAQAPAGAAQPMSISPGECAERATSEDMNPEQMLALLSCGLPPPQPVLTGGATAQSVQSVVEVALASSALPPRSIEIAAGQVAADAISAEPTASHEAARGTEVQMPTVAPEAPQPQRTTAASDTVARPLHAPVGSTRWADEIGSRLILMAEQGRQTASLRLSPEHLGPLEINITVRDDKASVWFGAAHADTRAAIEHALPRLREMLESQGLSLADSGVFREPPREQPMSGAPGPLLNSQSADDPGAVVTARVRLGLIDAYA